MRVLLRPVLVPELGLVIVKPGRESMPVFHNTRVLVEPEPKSMRNLPSGVVPAVRQPLAEDKSLLPFFSDERVIRAAGGAGALSDWLLRHVKSCQWPHGDYHHSETVIHRYGTGAMVLCWHCDNQLRDQTSESLGQLAHQNLSAWMIDVIRHAMNGSQERELSLAELSWWAVRNQVADALPEAVLRRSLGLRAEKIRSMYRESDIVPGEQTATSILKQRTKNLAPLPHAHQQNPPQEETVVSIAVDPESPESFMKRPKRRRWVNEKYTRWVPYTDVWTHKPVQFYPGKHPCEKPAEMLQQIISASSRPGDLVADFFMGSGSTVKAALALGRRAIGVELETGRFEQTVREVQDLIV
ncbi:DNA methyltransferase [Escherichia coli]